MSETTDIAETVTLLQELGLKEYEARCFLALSRLPTGTAKEISEISEVPRTRVYDAIRVLEVQGLVEVQHSNPQQFRAVSVEEATDTLRQKFDQRIETLGTHLETIDSPDEAADDRLQEVWSLTGREAVQSRTLDLVENADSEIVLIVVEEALLTEALFERLHDAGERGVNVVIGAQTASIVSELESELPSIEVFETELGWLRGPEAANEVAINRLLLVDRTTLLVTSYYPADGHEETDEQAIFATGLDNGVVVIIRRLLSTGLLPVLTSSPRTN